MEDNRWKSEFLALVAHELVTPLTPVMGYASTLLKHGPMMSDEQRAQALIAIHRRSRQMARIIDSAVLLEQIDNGTLIPVPDDVDMAPAIAAILRDRAEAVTIDCPESLVVRADPGLLAKMLGALIDNVIEFGAAPREILVRQVGASVEMRVTDGGPAVPEDFVRHLVERFSQADTGSTRKHGGLGIGLAVAHELAGLQGGGVWYEATGHQTCFGLRLPRGGPAANLPETLVSAAATLATSDSIGEAEAVIDLIAMADGDAAAVEQARRDCLRLGVSVPSCRKAAHLLALAKADGFEA